MLPEFDKNTAFIWACYGLGSLILGITLIAALLKAHFAKVRLARLEARPEESDPS